MSEPVTTETEVFALWFRPQPRARWQKIVQGTREACVQFEFTHAKLFKHSHYFAGPEGVDPNEQKMF